MKDVPVEKDDDTNPLREKVGLFILVVAILLAGFSGTGGFVSNAIVTLSKLIIAVSVFILVYGMVPQRVQKNMREAGRLGLAAYWMGIAALIAASVWIGGLGQAIIASFFSST